MSKQRDKLQRMLELATAAPDATQGDLDVETASLRDAWLAFGQLLESSESAVEPAADIWVMPQAKRRGRWLLSAVAALAASLLIGVLTVFAFRSEQVAKVERQTPDAGQIAKRSPQSPAAVSVAVSQARTAASGSKWNDSWDEQVAQVGQDVLYAQQDLYANSDPTRAVQYGIEQMRQDVEESKL